MPDDRKKMYSKQSTGTVPKTKHRNNTALINHDNFQRNLSNNLGLDWQRQDYPNYSRNSERNLYHLPYPMEATFTDHRQNPSSQLNLSVATANGTLSTSSTSGSNSRRDSVGTIPKCDNVRKCPDKTQIEDKLNQIREYLQVTTSLMSSIKNEDQSAVNEIESFKKMIKDLKDSEAKLLVLLNDPLFDDSCDPPAVPLVEEPLENGMDNSSETSATSGYQRNELEEKVELTNRKVQLLREQQNALINLKRKAENQLRDAREAQENLLLMQQQQKGENRSRHSEVDAEQVSNDILVNGKNLTENQFDVTIKELEDRLDTMRNDARRSVVNGQENNPLDFLHEHLTSNNQLLHLLDNRDTQLNSEHFELQQKLNDLHGKKMQIDLLAQQLQNLGDEDDEDIGNQVRKIVTMKQQLSSLKDLLEVVKNTEFSLLDSQNVNEVETEPQEVNHSGSIKRDNIRQNSRMNCNQNDSARIENNPRVNEQWITEKKSNKSIVNIKEREKVLAELKSKKRELEEIMYKQKDSTSINNDVCSEASVNKSDVGTNNMFDNVVMSWLPVHPYQRNQVASVYSSDECAEEDINEYSELNSSADLPIGTVPQPQPVLTSNYASFSKRTDSNQPFDGRRPRGFPRQSTSRTTEPCIPTVSSTTPILDQERPGPNSSSEANSTSKAQLQKQLELIQSVCQSLLDQQSSHANTNNVHHLRNNLTPSPMYAEPRSYISANQQRQSSALNSVNPTIDMPYFNNPHPLNYFALGEIANNQNMLAANTLQTQAFLLNTLNQCCQMLWFQQREIASLRSMVCTMQDQMMNGQPEQDMNSVPIPPSSFVFPTRPASSLSNFRPPSQPRNTNPKVNHVSAACSLPNLNPSTLHANVDHAYLNQNNIRSSASARLLESSLNNTTPIHSHLNLSGESPANNTVLPSVNVNTGIVQPLPTQVWNGQALNNQVPPGNRANNYWDNFRSYSRQNLLSTSSKSNEGLQNAASVGTILDRPNALSQSSYTLHPFIPPKLNMVHNESTNTSEEGTPRRSQSSSSSNKPIATIPPDVLNINHNSNQKRNEQHTSINTISLDVSVPYSNLQTDRNGSHNDVRSFKDYSLSGHRNRNEWHDNEQCENVPKSKLFEELRENVYKEVANLISANENRPHFLIQLFRDLQHMNSDSLRGRTLQSIQTVLTNSLSALDNVRGGNRQSSMAPIHIDPIHIDQDTAQANMEDFSAQQSLWPQSPISTSQHSSNVELENNEDPDIHNILKMVFSFLKSHNDEVLQSELTDLLKDLIIKAMPFTQMFANTNLQERTFHNHFISILNEAFEKYQGRRISEIKKDLLKTITEVLVGEFSFIYLVQENIPDNCENITAQCTSSALSDNPLSLNLQSQPMLQIVEEGNTPQMQNGDLAEADQSRLELLDEEGAVGGILNVIVEGSSTNAVSIVDANVVDIAAVDFPANAESEIEFVEQGLDQVPTRLSTGSRSHSNTPSRDRSNNSRSDHADHF